MNFAEQKILAIPSPFALQGTIKVLEGDCSDPAAILDRIFRGEYDKPFLLEDGKTRFLHFSLAHVQSAMCISNPGALELAYTRKMMSFALFHPQPRKILMLGLGGGSLAKFCHKHYPDAEITVVEINPQVLAFRDEFHVPEESERFTIVLADAAEFVASNRRTFDVILADAFDRHGFAGSLCNREFYTNLKRQIGDSGMLVSNLAGDNPERLAHLRMLRQTFGENTLSIPVGVDDNDVAIAFGNPGFVANRECVLERAKNLSQTVELDFPRFARKLMAQN